MNHIARLLIIGLVLNSVAHAAKFHCNRLDSGASAKVDFDSEIPLLNESGLKLITQTGACGQSFDFKGNCSVNLIKQGDEYSYGFRCDEVFGDLYFTGLNGGAAQFRCFGEKVPASYNDRIYRSCTVSE